MRELIEWTGITILALLGIFLFTIAAFGPANTSSDVTEEKDFYTLDVTIDGTGDKRVQIWLPAGETSFDGICFGQDPSGYYFDVALIKPNGHFAAMLFGKYHETGSSCTGGTQGMINYSGEYTLDIDAVGYWEVWIKQQRE